MTPSPANGALPSGSTPDRTRGRGRVRRVLQALAGLGALGAVGLAMLVESGGVRYYRWEWRREDLAPADALVVLGLRLSSDGQATTLLHNRVAMAADLFARGLAPRLIVTGGNAQAGVTEAARMAALAAALGVPAERIVLEGSARTTLENARFSAALMVEHGWRSAIVVSDGLHLGYAIPVFRDEFAARGLRLFWAPVDREVLEARGTVRRLGD